MQQMFDVLKEILVSKLKVAPEQVSLDATRDDVELDSLAVVELSLVLEKELGVAVSEEDLFGTATIKDMVLLLEERSSVS